MRQLYRQPPHCINLRRVLPGNTESQHFRNMASKTRSTKLPPDLAEVAELRAQQLGYPSWNAYVKGLIRYDALVCGPHIVTLPWSAQPLAEQDRIDAKLLDITRRGIGERGQLLRRILDGSSDVLKIDLQRKRKP